MARITEIRSAIKSVLDTIPDIGNVHTYERFAKRTSDFKSFYEVTIGTENQIRGWYIRRIKTKTITIAQGVYSSEITWLIRGYLSVSDSNESEVVFDELIEAIEQKVIANDTLEGTVQTCILEDDLAGVQVEDTGHVMLSNVLCHEVILSLTTRMTH